MSTRNKFWFITNPAGGHKPCTLFKELMCEYNIPHGSYGDVLEDTFFREVPSHLVIGMVESEAHLSFIKVLLCWNVLTYHQHNSLSLVKLVSDNLSN